MNILVTGGAGFIGSNITRFLCDKKHRVICLDDFSCADFRNLQGLDCELIYGDVVKEGIFKKMPRLDAVIHEAAITDTTLKDDKKMVAVNFSGFKNVLGYCLKQRVKLVYASSAGVYGDVPSPMREDCPVNPLNIYAYSKYQCDRAAISLIKSKNTPPLVGLRYFNVYGPGEHHKNKAASMIYQLYLQMKQDRRPRVFKCGEQKRDFIYVKDVVAATVKSLELDKSAVVNVGTGNARSFNDIIKIINGVLKKNLSADYFDNPCTGVYQNNTEADINNLKKIIGYIPQYSLEEGIKDYISNYLNGKGGL
ncbi:MAG: ADP-glyceromanno-heptose 6-epimerase [Candidatus Omnitrophota bacterium]